MINLLRWIGWRLTLSSRKYGKRLREKSLDTPLNFYITNNMFDETQLYVAAPRGGTAQKRRTVAQACQIAYQKPARPGGPLPIHDKDIVRTPALLQTCTAAACAARLARVVDGGEHCRRRATPQRSRGVGLRKQRRWRLGEELRRSWLGRGGRGRRLTVGPP